MPLTRDFAPGGTPRSWCPIVFCTSLFSPISSGPLSPSRGLLVWFLALVTFVVSAPSAEAGSPVPAELSENLLADSPHASEPLHSARVDNEDEDDDADEDWDEEEEGEDPAEAALTEAVYAHLAIPAERTKRRRNTRAPEGPDRDERLLESEQRFSEIAELYPDTRVAEEALFWIAECQRKLEDFEIAFESYKKALLTEGGGEQGAGVRLGWARCQLAFGDPETALPKLDHVIANDSGGREIIEALYFRGIALRELERYAEAHAAWDRLQQDYDGDIWSTRAKNSRDTLRPVRERLEAWIPHFEEVKAEYLATPRRQKRDALPAVQKALNQFAQARAPETENWLTSLIRKEGGDIRAAAVAPLLAVGGPRAAKMLIAQADSFDEPTVVALLEGLRRKHLAKVKLKVFEDHLGSSKRTIQTAAVDMFGRAGTAEAARALVHAIPKENDRNKLSPAMKRTLTRIEGRLRRFRDKKAIQTLGRMLGSSREGVLRRTIIAEALGYTGSKHASEPLRDAMFDGSSEVAAAAVRSVGRLRADGAASEIAKLIMQRRRDEVFLKDAVRALANLDPTSAEEELIAISDAKDPSVRALVMRALGKIGTESAIDRLVEALLDPAWQVRSAALEGTKGMAHARVIEAVVASLEKEKGALRPALVERLITLLGVDKGPDPVLWREHWNHVKRTYDESAALAGADSDGKKSTTFVRKADPKAAQKPTYFGVEIVSKRLAFIIDVSGSMSQQVSVPTDDGGTNSMRRIDLARDELLRAVTALEAGTRFNIVKFDETPVLWNKKPVKLSKKSVKSARQFAQGLQPRGGTNIYDSLEMVLKAGVVDTIYLLSDGAPSAGTYTEPGRILEEIARLNEESQVTIHTIALGMDSGFMRSLAEQNKGTAVVAGQ